MKLLILSPYYPPHAGGLESHSEEFNRHVAAKGVSITVFTPRMPVTAPEREEAGHVSVVRYPAFELITNFPVPKLWSRRYRELYCELAHAEFDIVIPRTRF